MTASKSLTSASPSSAVLGWGIVLMGVSVSIAGLAFLLQRVGFAPVGLFSLLVGAAVGTGALLLGMLFSLKPRKALLVVTIFAAVIATTAQHGFLYFQYRSDFHGAPALNPRVAFFRGADPADFGTYIRAEAAKIEPVIGQPNWVYWLIDLTLCVSGAAGMYWFCQPRSPQESPNPNP